MTQIFASTSCNIADISKQIIIKKKTHKSSFIITVIVLQDMRTAPIKFAQRSENAISWSPGQLILFPAVMHLEHWQCFTSCVYYVRNKTLQGDTQYTQ